MRQKEGMVLLITEDLFDYRVADKPVDDGGKESVSLQGRRLRVAPCMGLQYGGQCKSSVRISSCL